MGNFTDILDWEKYFNPFPMRELRQSPASEILATVRDQINRSNWVTGVLWQPDGRGCLMGHLARVILPECDPLTIKAGYVGDLIETHRDLRVAMEALATVCAQKIERNWAEKITRLKECGQWNAKVWTGAVANYNDTRKCVEEIHAILSDAIEFLGDDSGLRYYDRQRYAQEILKRDPLPSFDIDAIYEGEKYPPLTPVAKAEPDPAERIVEPIVWDPDAELADLLEKEPVAA